MDGTDRIWVINADGSAAHAITPKTLVASWPVWSPDGKQIVFQGAKGTDNDLYIIPADGSKAPVDLNPDSQHNAFDAAWW
jgi:Tol biopolymer transport system component